jgi:hypothetical protein
MEKEKSRSEVILSYQTANQGRIYYEHVQSLCRTYPGRGAGAVGICLRKAENEANFQYCIIGQEETFG